MPYRNDQLVGCLPDALQGDLDELINLPTGNERPFNQINLNTNQYMLDAHQSPNRPSNQFAIERSELRDQTSTSQYVDNNSTVNFQSTDYDQPLDLDQLDDQSTNFNSNLDLFDIDDEFEFNHLKDLETLMETNQLDQSQLNSIQLTTNDQQVLNRISPNQLASNQLANNQLTSQLASNQLTGNQINQQVIINSRQGGSQSNRAQLNQASRFLTSSSTAHPTFDTNSRFNAKSAQINSPQRTTSTIQANNSTNDNTFLAAVNSTQVNNSPCGNFLKSTSPNPFNTQFSSQQLTNSTNTSYTDRLVNSGLNTTIGASNPLNSNLNLVNNQLKNSTFYQEQAFLRESEQPTSTNMIKSDLQASNLLASNLNCYQANQFATRLIASPTQLLNNQYSSPIQSSNMQTSELAIINSKPSTPVKHIPQFKSSPTISSSLASPTNNNLSKVRSPSNEWLDTVANQVAQDMRRCGICVIDSFLGKLFCNTILEEVIEMYGDGFFQDGLLVGNKQNGDKNIRGDKIHWVEGKESNCQNIGYLMRTLDQIMMRFSRLNVDGCTSIMNRTKAMIACYPGNGTKYVKHVDNPNNDGRYITCIYYLNKNWNSERDGGTLRIFPKNVPYVANIEPLFDRVIFFWSDRRNPHEVMPAYSIRFAITLWYFNSKEREQYIKNVQAIQQSAQS